METKNAQDLKNLNTQFLEKRAHEIQKNLRCLDCQEITYTIEHVDSPIAQEQKQLIRFLLRKGYSDLEVYKEIGNLYGQHSIMRLKVSDDSAFNVQMENKIVNQFMGFGILTGVGFMGFKYLKKFAKK
ncbi:hypothetical protein PPERSA_03718 [Pseudocohnilembus persalinus]|uniref:CcmH/CycL/Ccl2/NrfF N-terminal domain-containing protein n=1 Tax=Pseudocohnilembus persalinus TaxID=266149 RepID=A0A0V0QHH3_PSEPJ|nr:hypothetical protein PPERSA_03718 [Pseudocohnilembus persalinus]|eukprot:KRX01634.1 hypothetical protein PPERSA_03718 [Pseudocohnilembus persalinus]